MPNATRKKSPRAPSISLDVAIERTTRVYEKEGRHPVALEIVAQDLGYKGVNNGAFLTTIASLRYFGLMDRPKEGHLAVTKEFESFKFAPSEDLRQELQIKWLKNPAIFGDLLREYGDRLPSDAKIKFDLLELGFSPRAADDCVAVFRRSVDFARYYDALAAETDLTESSVTEAGSQSVDGDGDGNRPGVSVVPQGDNGVISGRPEDAFVSSSGDRIPVRLNGGRRAWLEIPEPFYEADKKRLIAQIELILTEDESSDTEN